MAKGFEIPGLGDLVEQAKAMQERLASAQAEAGLRVVEASAGGGMVTASIRRSSRRAIERCCRTSSSPP